MVFFFVYYIDIIIIKVIDDILNIIFHKMLNILFLVYNEGGNYIIYINFIKCCKFYDLCTYFII
jgi:hypothetical protein